MKIVHEGFLYEVDGILHIEGFVVESDEVSEATLDAVMEYAWMEYALGRAE